MREGPDGTPIALKCNPKDFVRIEIASALAQGKRVIPVRVGDATMPKASYPRS